MTWELADLNLEFGENKHGNDFYSLDKGTIKLGRFRCKKLDGADCTILFYMNCILDWKVQELYMSILDILEDKSIVTMILHLFVMPLGLLQIINNLTNNIFSLITISISTIVVVSNNGVKWMANRLNFNDPAQANR